MATNHPLPNSPNVDVYCLAFSASFFSKKLLQKRAISITHTNHVQIHSMYAYFMKDSSSLFVVLRGGEVSTTFLPLCEAQIPRPVNDRVAIDSC